MLGAVLVKAAVCTFCLFVSISVWNLQLQLFVELLSTHGCALVMRGWWLYPRALRMIRGGRVIKNAFWLFAGGSNSY